MISALFLAPRINPWCHAHTFVLKWTPVSPSYKSANEEWASFIRELASFDGGEMDHVESDSDPDL